MLEPPFEKRHKKTGGRKKGTPNKRNTAIQLALSKALTPKETKALIDSAIHQAKDGKPGLLLGLLPYGLQEMPKVIEHNGAPEENSRPITIKLTIDKFNDNGSEPA